MGRRAARAHALMLVFQSEFHTDFDLAESAEEYFSNIDTDRLTSADRDFAYQEAAGVLANRQEIDTLVTANLLSWSFERIGKIDLALMRLAVFEILYAPDIPVQVAINEAIELSKKYGDDDSPAFLNGVLGKIASITNPS